MMAEYPQEKVRITAEEYKTLAESNLHTELLDGELIVYEGKDGMSPAPKDQHQQIILIVLAFLLRFFPASELRTAPTDVFIDETNVVQPDIFWASAESGQCARRDDGYLHGAPDFVVEILSPSTARYDRGVKFDLYEQHGVREYWMLDSEGRFVEVYMRTEGRFVRQGLYEQGQAFTSAILGGKLAEVAALLGEQRTG